MPIQWNEISAKSKGGTELLCRALEQKLPINLLDQVQIIPSRVRELDETRHRILWLHDLPRDPESDKALKDGAWYKYHKIVCVSNWQQQAYQSYYEIPWSRMEVLLNAIEPIPAEWMIKADPEKQIDIIYTSTPHRGLVLLYPVFKELCKKYDNLHLHVYSSFKVYGWDDQDKNFEPLFMQLRDDPKVTFVQGCDNEEVRAAIAKAHIFAYPSIWMETSCLCLMEALSAGCVNVHPNLGALYETAANWSIMYQWHENNQEHAKVFFNHLDSAIQLVAKAEPDLVEHLELQKKYADMMYSWETRSFEWTETIKDVLALPLELEKPTPVEYFTYSA